MKQNRVLIISNSAFSVWNFRNELIQTLYDEGYNISIIAEFSANDNFKIPKSFHCTNLRYPRNIFELHIAIIYVIKLILILRIYSPNYVLSFTIFPNIVSCLLKFFYNYNLLSNVTGFGKLKVSNNLIHKLIFNFYKKILTKANVVFVQNNDDLKIMNDYNLKKLLQLPGSGIRLNKKMVTNINKDSLNILFLGRLIKDKGVLQLLHVAKSFPNINFKFVGFTDLSEKKILKKLIHVSSEFPHIEYKSGTNKPYEEIKWSTFLCAPSLYGEGTPRVLIEALALGRGIITTNIPGSNTCVDDGKNGFILSTNNIEADLFTVLKKVQNFDLEDLKKISHFSLKKSLNFDVEIIISKYLKEMTKN